MRGREERRNAREEREGEGKREKIGEEGENDRRENERGGEKRGIRDGGSDIF